MGLPQPVQPRPWPGEKSSLASGATEKAGALLYSESPAEGDAASTLKQACGPGFQCRVTFRHREHAGGPVGRLGGQVLRVQRNFLVSVHGLKSVEGTSVLVVCPRSTIRAHH